MTKMDSLVDFYLSRLGQKLAEKGVIVDIAQMREEYDKVNLETARCDLLT